LGVFVIGTIEAAVYLRLVGYKLSPEDSLKGNTINWLWESHRIFVDGLIDGNTATSSLLIPTAALLTGGTNINSPKSQKTADKTSSWVRKLG